MLLEFPSEAELNALFSGNKYRLRDKDGNYRIDSVVKGGTAIGIVGNLPKFQRIIQTVPTMDGISSKKYFLIALRYRKDVYCTILCTRKSVREASCVVRPRREIKHHMERLTSTFFVVDFLVCSKQYNGAMFLRFCFTFLERQNKDRETSEIYNCQLTLGSHLEEHGEETRK